MIHAMDIPKNEMEFSSKTEGEWNLADFWLEDEQDFIELNDISEEILSNTGKENAYEYQFILLFTV